MSDAKWCGYILILVVVKKRILTMVFEDGIVDDSFMFYKIVDNYYYMLVEVSLS